MSLIDPGILRLYLVTDPVLCGERGVYETCRQALAAGVRTVQLRDKTASTRSLIRLSLRLASLCRQHGALFIINDRVDVALAADAGGVHLGKDDMPVGTARKILGPAAVIGTSVRSCEEARRAEAQGADYLAANLVFATDTKQDIEGPLGMEGVGELRRASELPLIAIGGIKPSNTAEVLKAGADGIAVVSAIMAADDVEAAVEQFRRIVG